MPEPEVIAMPIGMSAYKYFRRLVELGAIDGTLGSQAVATSIEPLLEGIHHVLAGGDVSVSINTAGSSTIVDELDGLVDAATTESNTVNDKNGYYGLIT